MKTPNSTATRKIIKQSHYETERLITLAVAAHLEATATLLVPDPWRTEAEKERLAFLREDLLARARRLRETATSKSVQTYSTASRLAQPQPVRVTITPNGKPSAVANNHGGSNAH